MLISNRARFLARLSAFLLVMPLPAARAQTTDTAPASPTPAPDAPTEAKPEPEPEARRKRRIPPLGPQVDATFFQNARTRSRFGASAFSFSLGVGDSAPSFKGSISPDVSVTSVSRTRSGVKNRLFLLSVGPEYKRAYIPPAIKRMIEQKMRVAIAASQSDTPAPDGTPPTSSPPRPPSGNPPFMAYYGAGVNALYAHVKSPADGINGSGVGAGGSVFVGAVLGGRFTLEGRLRASTKVKGFDFSGAVLSVGLRF